MWAVGTQTQVLTPVWHSFSICGDKKKKYRLPGQPGLHRETLTWKTNKITTTTKKKKNQTLFQRTGEMARWLRLLAVLPESAG
jgi:hypothetical protein